MANNRKRVSPRKTKTVLPPKPVTNRITVEITEGQPPDVSCSTLDIYSWPTYLRKAALAVEYFLKIRE